MSFLVRFTPTSLTQAKYDQTIRRLEEGDGAFPPDGLEFHVCFGSDGICVSARSGTLESSPRLSVSG